MAGSGTGGGASSSMINLGTTALIGGPHLKGLQHALLGALEVGSAPAPARVQCIEEPGVFEQGLAGRDQAADRVAVAGGRADGGDETRIHHAVLDSDGFGGNVVSTAHH